MKKSRLKSEWNKTIRRIKKMQKKAVKNEKRIVRKKEKLNRMYGTAAYRNTDSIEYSQEDENIVKET